MELDLYRATYTGICPPDLFKKNPGRFPPVYLKDVARTEKWEFAEVPYRNSVLPFTYEAVQPSVLCVTLSYLVLAGRSHDKFAAYFSILQA